ncbi:MAG: hypothetical protein LDL23_04165, partial [Flavobacterium sp.]|uniref:hypothetical protein n=1 Tax=Flavobacterium sp. TaxID=239 RepID=UPI0025B88455
EEQYQFTIANKPVKVIETESATSYTILINRAIDDVNSFENLIVQQLNSGETTANIIKYVPFQPATIESYFLNGDFNGNRTITLIVYNDNLINTTNKITNVCSTVCTTLCYDCKPNYSSEYQTPHTPGANCPTSSISTSCEQVCVTYDDGGGSSSNPIDITGGGGTGGTDDLDTPHNDSGNNNPIVTAPVLELEEENEENNEIDPCISLKETQKTDKANINPILQNYKTNLYHFGENATRINKNNLSPQLPISNNYSYTQNVMPLSLDRSIDVPILSNQTIIIIHTHPYPLTYSMFSWGDAYQYLMLNQLSNIYRNDLTLMLVTYNPVTNTNDVYALKVENMRNFRNKMNNQLNSLGTMDLNLKIKKLNEKLGDKFESETNLEKAFLEYFDGYGISLYKAEDNLSNWKKLEKNLDPVSYLVNPVIEKPCNN